MRQAGILLVLASLGSAEKVEVEVETSLWAGWALVTPVLGDLSPGCVAASQSYINNLNAAFLVEWSTLIGWDHHDHQISYAIKAPKAPWIKSKKSP